MRLKKQILFIVILLLPMICRANHGIDGIGKAIDFLVGMVFYGILFLITSVLARQANKQNSFYKAIIALVLNTILTTIALFTLCKTIANENIIQSDMSNSIIAFPIVILIIVLLVYIPIIKVFRKRIKSKKNET